MNTFKLEIIATDRIFFQGESEMTVLPAIDGEQGILAGHEATVVALQAGEMRYTVAGQERIAVIGDGFAEVMPDRVIVLADFAEKPEEIDVLRAEQEKILAEEAMQMQKSRMEYIQSRVQLARALTELQAAKRYLR